MLVDSCNKKSSTSLQTAKNGEVIHNICNNKPESDGLPHSRQSLAMTTQPKSFNQCFTPPSLLESSRWQGQRIGLLGGSFNPPHKGHLHISLIAMEVLKLDFVWWMVTPQNPFKQADSTMPFEKRFELCRQTADHPRVLISSIENELGYTRTIHTIKKLKTHFPNTSFVWITGMDVVHQLHRWYKWKDLLDQIPMAHICRPPANSVIKNVPARMLRGRNHIYPSKASRYSLEPRNTYWILQKKMVNISSTDLREENLTHEK